MFHIGSKKQNYAVSVVSTLITFVFFLCFVYSSYVVATDMLLHSVVDSTEYAQKVDGWDYNECESPTAYIHAQLGLDDEYGQSYSAEVKLLNLPEIEAEKLITKNEETKIEMCKDIIVARAESLQGIDYQIKMVRHGLAMLFFLILFLGFAFQSERIYRKMK